MGQAACNKADRGLTQSCDRFVGRYDVGEFVVEARETRAVDQVGGEDLSVRSFPIEGCTHESPTTQVSNPRLPDILAVVDPQWSVVSAAITTVVAPAA